MHRGRTWAPIGYPSSDPVTRFHTPVGSTDAMPRIRLGEGSSEMARAWLP